MSSKYLCCELKIQMMLTFTQVDYLLYDCLFVLNYFYFVLYMMVFCYGVCVAAVFPGATLCVKRFCWAPVCSTLLLQQRSTRLLQPRCTGLPHTATAATQHSTPAAHCSGSHAASVCSTCSGRHAAPVCSTVLLQSRSTGLQYTAPLQPRSTGLQHTALQSRTSSSLLTHN